MKSTTVTGEERVDSEKQLNEAAECLLGGTGLISFAVMLTFGLAAGLALLGLFFIFVAAAKARGALER